MLRAVAGVDNFGVRRCALQPEPRTRQERNDCLLNGTGMEMEIFQVIAREAGFKVQLQKIKDVDYGSRNEVTGTWTGEQHMQTLPKTNIKRHTGMIGNLTRNETDMTAMLMSIRADRLDVVDFSYPINVQQVCDTCAHTCSTYTLYSRYCLWVSRKAVRTK
jgi:hypothetical protein